MLSIPHMIVVFIIVLVVFGPNKLPELARGFGKLMAEFRKASGDFKSAFEQEMREIERQAVVTERKKAADAAAAAVAAVPAQPATQATPSGADSSLPFDPAADTRATEAQVGAQVGTQVSDAPAPDLVVTPVPEAIARETAAYSAVDAASSTNGAETLASASDQAKPDRSTASHEPTHDTQQPA
jgi:TatA/E family protein of Tat protein translocase